MKEVVLAARAYEAVTDREGLLLPPGNNVVSISVDGHEIILPMDSAKEFGEWLASGHNNGSSWCISEVWDV